MIPATLSAVLEMEIAALLGRFLPLGSFQSLTGGCIHQTVSFEAGGERFCLKYNPNKGQTAKMFQTEAAGLKILAETGGVQTPVVYSCAAVENFAYLLLSFVESENPTNEFWENLGRALAGLHRKTEKEFGLDHDNFIGSLPQNNDRRANWCDFFIEKRLEPQLALAVDKGLAAEAWTRKFEGLFHRLERYFPPEPPALLHGDLWAGNLLCAPDQQPVFIDPAVFYGHREAELAFSQLFGVFGREFYQSYAELFPLESGFAQRAVLYNLYPLLVHLNLFGESYALQIKEIITRF